MIKTTEVLAGAYKGKRAAFMHTHAYDTTTFRPLCGKVEADSLAGWAQDEDAPATCPVCAKRDPRNPQHANDGPFILKSLIQF